MISSIPILMIERSFDETLSLLVLSEMIPSTAEDKFIKQKVTQRLLNRQYGQKKTRNYRENSIRDSQIYNKYKSMIDEGILIPDYIRDPVEQFFIRAIVDKKNWAQLITENGWDKLFPEQEKKSWSIYEQWIIFICFKGFKTKEAFFLSFHLTKNCHNFIKNYRKSSNSFHEIKFQNWIKKSVSQLNRIDYENQKQLLISIKLKESFHQTLHRLNFQKILQCPQNSLEMDFNRWTQFLCTKFESNRPPMKPVLFQQRFNWKSIEQKNQKSQLKTKYLQYEYKLHFILNTYTNFEASFTNEVQASLLRDLSLKKNWKNAKQNINRVIEINRSLVYDSKNKKNSQIDQKDKKIKRDLQLSLNQNSNSFNFMQEESSMLPTQISCPLKYQFPFLGGTTGKLSDNQRKSDKLHDTLMIKIQNSKQNKYPEQEVFYDKDQSHFRRQLYSTKLQNQQNYENERDFFDSYYLQPRGLQMATTAKHQQDMISINIEQFPIQHEETLSKNIKQQFSYQRSKTIPNSMSNVDQRLNNVEEEEEEDDELRLSTEQNLILSLLGKAHESLEQLKKKYFSDISQVSLQNYFNENKEIIKPMHQSLLSICRCNGSANTISNQNIRKMIETILNVDLDEQNSQQQEKQQTLQLSQQEMARQFADGFDRLLKSFQTEKQFIQQQMQ